MSDPSEYVTITSAGHLTGVPARTLRRWAQTGKVAASSGKQGRLVRLADVQHLAALTGHAPASGHVAAESAGQVTGQVASEETANPNVAISPAARGQLEAIRDEWLQPLVDQLRKAERTIGRLEQERDGLRERLAELEERQDASETRSAPHHGADPPAEGDETSQPWWRRWLKW